MSVVDLIRMREVRMALDPLVDLTRPKRTYPLPLLVPSADPKLAGLIGTAFDYSVRFLLNRHNPSARTGTWIAELSARKLRDFATRMSEYEDLSQEEIRPVIRTAEHAEFRVRNARTFLRKHLKRRVLDQPWLERLAVHALKLARLDPHYRSGYSEDQLLATDGFTTISEVLALLRLAPIERLSQASLWLNPTFGRYSELVGGADADLIAGNRLIELKTSKQPCVERPHICQLLVYSMLVDFLRNDGAAFPEIRTIEIYFARHGQLISFDLMRARASSRYKAASSAIIDCARRRYARATAKFDRAARQETSTSATPSRAL